MSTINDVSRLAGVSKATVSRVLSGSRGVKEASRLAVLKAVEELNYRPNVIAQSLFSQTTHCIGVICAQENVNQITAWLFALEKQLRQHQKHLLLRFARSKSEVLTALEELSGGRCDEVLITQGRRQIALIQPENGGTAGQLLLGYKLALENNLLPFNRNLVITEAVSSSVAIQMLLNNASSRSFNALLVANEQEAQNAMAQLQAFNKAVPKDVMVFSLAGSVNLPGLPTIPAIEYSLDLLASRIGGWLTASTQQMLGSSVLRGDLIIPDWRQR